jgi:hypothetical protein
MDAARVQAALQVVRRGALQGKGGALEIRCFCAVEDRPYILQFELGQNGIFSYRQSIRGMVTGAAAARGIAIVSGIALEKLEDVAFPCAWCGDGGINYCGNDCKALVCGGRYVGNRFHCRDSCKATWIGIPLVEIEAELWKPRQRPMAAPSQRAQAPIANRLQLGTGSALVRRR